MKNTRNLIIFALLTLTPILGSGAVFIKFDGVDGESKDKDHKGWSDLSSVSIRTGDQKGWSDLQSLSHGLPQDDTSSSSGQATGRRDGASGLATGKRDAASGLPTGKRDAASGLPTGKRDAASGLPTGKRQHKPIRISKPIDQATPILARALSSGNSIGNVSIQRVEKGKTETLNLINAKVVAISGVAPNEEVTFDYEEINHSQNANVEVRGWDAKKK